MKLSYVYFGLCLLGLIIPFSEFVPFYLVFGFNSHEVYRLAYANQINALLNWDLLLATLAGAVYIMVEGKRLKLKYYWVPLFCIFFIGFAFGLPLFLYLRELHLERLAEQTE